MAVLWADELQGLKQQQPAVWSDDMTTSVTLQTQHQVFNAPVRHDGGVRVIHDWPLRVKCWRADRQFVAELQKFENITSDVQIDTSILKLLIWYRFLYNK